MRDHHLPYLGITTLEKAGKEGHASP